MCCQAECRLVLVALWLRFAAVGIVSCYYGDGGDSCRTSSESLGSMSSRSIRFENSSWGLNRSTGTENRLGPGYWQGCLDRFA